MTAMVAEDLAQIPMSPYLAASLQRAAKYAEAQAHQEVTLEHVLLALAEDPEASVILRTSNVNIERLQTDVSNHLGNISERQDPASPTPVNTADDLQRILEAAAEAAKQGQRREINGAILLAAIVGDGASTAAHILRAQGLTFEATIAALRNTVQQTSQPPPEHHPQPDQVTTGPPVPPTPVESVTANDVLAEARERVNSRRAPGTEPVVTAPVAKPSLEPQWEQATPAAESAENADDLSVQSSDDALSEISEPIPAGVQPPPSSALGSAQPRSQEADAAHWAPPQPTEKPERSPAPPRLQRVPPPLPPDAGLRPPRSQSGPSVSAPPSGQQPMPSPAPADVAPRQSSVLFSPPTVATGAAGQDPQRVPPWVGEGSARGRSQGPASAPQRPGRADGPAQHPRSTQIRVETGQMVENIPRKMKAGVPEHVEVRIARANVKALAQGLQGGGAAYKHEAMITKAMSVKLRAPDGGFWVEAASPETQWIENVLGVMTDDFASWRWTVTPKTSGQKKLQLVVSARTVGSDGLAAETALPDQLFDVRVGINYQRSSKRVAGWLVAAIFGGVLARFGESAFDVAKGLIEKIASG